MQETQVCSLGGEDALEKGMAAHSFSCLENPMDRGAWQTTVCEVVRVRHYLATKLLLLLNLLQYRFCFMFLGFWP